MAVILNLGETISFSPLGGSNLNLMFPFLSDCIEIVFKNFGSLKISSLSAASISKVRLSEFIKSGSLKRLKIFEISELFSNLLFLINS